MGKHIGYQKEKVLEAIKDSGGITSAVARRLKCTWRTAKKYINEWEDTRIAFEDENEVVLDMAQSKLYQSIKEGNTQDAKWLLATKGKRRGFTERQEITGADGGELTLNVKVNLVESNRTEN
jgi:hypothetical protein